MYFELQFGSLNQENGVNGNFPCSFTKNIWIWQLAHKDGDLLIIILGDTREGRGFDEIVFIFLSM